MDFVTEQELTSLRAEIEKEYGSIQRLRQVEDRIDAVINLANMMDYYMILGAADETVIEGVSMMKDGSYVALHSTFGVNETHRCATGNANTPADFFTDTLSTVRDAYAQQSMKKAA